MGHLKVKVFTC